MAKEIYLYSGIYSYTAEYFIRDLDENKNSDVAIRMNTDGGDPKAMYGMAAKMREHPKDVLIKVDGKANSSGFFLLPFAKRVRALNVSEFIIHRAAYPEWYEQNQMTDDDLQALTTINADLRKAVEMKVDTAKFYQVTGKTLDEIFDMNARIDVRVTAAQMKELGLVDEIVDITDSKISAEYKAISTMLDFNLFEKPSVAANKESSNDKKNTTMTLAELKDKFPAIYAEALQVGATAEKERIGAWMTFVDVDPKRIAEAIKKGETLGAAETAELTRKSVSAELLKDTQKETEKKVTTEEPESPAKPEATAKEKEQATFLEEVKGHLKN
jgi:ATP-dependent protease ClpP protease subunit